MSDNKPSGEEPVISKRECITHHYACDCREAKFKETTERLQRLEAENAALKQQIQDCNDNL